MKVFLSPLETDGSNSMNDYNRFRVMARINQCDMIMTQSPVETNVCKLFSVKDMHYYMGIGSDVAEFSLSGAESMAKLCIDKLTERNKGHKIIVFVTNHNGVILTTYQDRKI